MPMLTLNIKDRNNILLTGFDITWAPRVINGTTVRKENGSGKAFDYGTEARGNLTIIGPGDSTSPVQNYAHVEDANLAGDVEVTWTLDQCADSQKAHLDLAETMPLPTAATGISYAPDHDFSTQAALVGVAQNPRDLELPCTEFACSVSENVASVHGYVFRVLFSGTGGAYITKPLHLKPGTERIVQLPSGSGHARCHVWEADASGQIGAYVRETRVHFHRYRRPTSASVHMVAPEAPVAMSPAVKAFGPGFIYVPVPPSGFVTYTGAPATPSVRFDAQWGQDATKHNRALKTYLHNLVGPWIAKELSKARTWTTEAYYNQRTHAHFILNDHGGQGQTTSPAYTASYQLGGLTGNYSEDGFVDYVLVKWSA